MAQKKEDEDLLETARERFNLAEEAESELRTLALDDLRFSAGDQWPDHIKNERDTDNRPCLVINRIPQHINQITNDQRQNRPSIKVSAVDDDADIETAKIYQGMIRHIEYSAKADIAYDTAFKGAVTHGFGYYVIRTKYVDPMSFNQEIIIDDIRNPFTVYLDPFRKKPDGSDSEWGFIFDNVSKEAYKRDFPDSEMASMGDWQSIGDNAQGWLDENSCRVAEYYYKEYEDKEILLLEDGSVIEAEDIAKDAKSIVLDDEIEVKIVNRRIAKVPVVKWCKINAVEVLERTIIPCKWIPIVEVVGEVIDIDGKLIKHGIVRGAKDSQRMYNYWASTETEAIALAPRAPFIIGEGQIPEEYEHLWQSANTTNSAFLPYSPQTHQGQLLPPPQRNAFEPAVQAITNARMQAAEDLKSTTGIYDAAMGARSNETSGIAIQRRNQQAQTSNFHYIDNLTRSLGHGGRIMADMMPKVYDVPAAARIIGDEGDEEIIKLNQTFKRKGEDTHFDLSVGKYDVAIETGPSYATKRQEAAASMEAMTKSYPELMKFAGDLLIKNMDWPGAQEIAERIKKMLPPELMENKDQKPLPPEVQNQLTQMNQMIEQLTTSLKDANEVISQKRMELESDERIAFGRMDTDLQREMLKQGAPGAIETINQQMAEINHRLDILGINLPIDHSDPDQITQNMPTGGPTPGQPPMEGY